MRPSGWLALAVLVLMPSAAAASAPKGPPGLNFYTPPHPLVRGAHGTLIWARGLTGPAVLRNAAVNELLLYRSVGVGDTPVAVSGTLAVPRGRPPRGGWPVISWG